jgi:hypothetical protein
MPAGEAGEEGAAGAGVAGAGMTGTGMTGAGTAGAGTAGVAGVGVAAGGAVTFPFGDADSGGVVADGAGTDNGVLLLSVDDDGVAPGFCATTPGEVAVAELGEVAELALGEVVTLVLGEVAVVPEIGEVAVLVIGEVAAVEAGWVIGFGLGEAAVVELGVAVPDPGSAPVELLVGATEVEPGTGTADELVGVAVVAPCAMVVVLEVPLAPPPSPGAAATITSAARPVKIGRARAGTALRLSNFM